ncbi:unnamed protein product [Meganyctiphanes norvegica]|uniref:Uncharacterized protein n=1 Tax=Meganyctiphanes norvegica TaxID=48144 RepID=A0AAV2SNJ1_MEGNR
MERQHVLGLPWLICCLLTIRGLQQVDCTSSCYECTDDQAYTDFPYDPDCGSFGYHGDSILDSGIEDMCSIVILNSGGIIRRANRGFSDGQCRYQPSYTQCFCAGAFCNTNSFCGQCEYPRPTPSTTYASSTLTTMKLSTPGSSLSCYSCIDCPTVDVSTPVVEDASFVTCVSTVLLSSGTEVVRGGSDEDHTDGECLQHSESLMCWCSSDLCNDGTFP